MSLFSKKPKQEPKREMPILPEFPDAPGDSRKQIPSYESTLAAIKKEVSNEVNIPIRKAPQHSLPAADTRFRPRPGPVMPTQHQDDKPIFVKLDQYKGAVTQLNEIKKKIGEAESLFEQLEHIKDEESRKLEAWRRDIQGVKQRLLDVDKNLFGV